jgi:hypothetical protein
MILGIFKKMLPWLYHDPVGFLIEINIEHLSGNMLFFFLPGAPH